MKVNTNTILPFFGWLQKHSSHMLSPWVFQSSGRGGYVTQFYILHFSGLRGLVQAWAPDIDWLTQLYTTSLYLLLLRKRPPNLLFKIRFEYQKLCTWSNWQSSCHLEIKPNRGAEMRDLRDQFIQIWLKALLFLFNFVSQSFQLFAFFCLSWTVSHRHSESQLIHQLKPLILQT